MIGQVWYSLEAWRELERAVAAAGLGERLCSHAEFVAEFDRFVRKCEKRGERVKKVSIVVPDMVAWIDQRGYKFDAAARRRYAAFAARAYRAGERGLLVCWQGGADSRVDRRFGAGRRDGSTGARIAAAAAAERAARAKAAEDADGENYNRWGRRPWRVAGS